MEDKIEGIAYGMLDFMSKPFVDPDTPGFDKVKGSPPETVKLLHFSSPTLADLSQELKTASEDVDLKRKPSLHAKSTPDSAAFRQTVLCSSPSNLQETLTKLRTPEHLSKTLQTLRQPPKLCFLVTCQGTHYPGMGKKMYASSPIFRQHFDYCSRHVQAEWGININAFLEEEIQPNVVPFWMESAINFLPYLLALEYALFKQWESWGIKPDYVLGLSFGEYGAAVFAGIITIEEAFKLIMTRIILMTKNIKEEAFCVAQMDTTKFAEIMEEAKKEEGMEEMWLDVSAINSPKQTCCVGHLKYVNQFSATCKKHGIKTLIKEYHPYHSSLTKPILPEFEETTKSITYQKSTAKFISTVDGKMWDTLNPTYFLDHLTGPVIAIGAVETVLEEGVTHFLEVGPHPIIIQMVKDILQNNDPNASKKYTFVTSLTRNEDDRIALLNSVGRLYTAGYDVNWEGVEEFQS